LKISAIRLMIFCHPATVSGGMAISAVFIIAPLL
jgi:hypothetical protein